MARLWIHHDLDLQQKKICETHLSYLQELHRLLWKGLEHFCSKERQVYIFISNDFKKGCFDVSFVTRICVHNSYFETENFLHKLIMFCFLSLLNSRQSNCFLY